MAYCIAVKWTIKDGEMDAVLAAMRPLMAASRAEPGCLQYDLHRDPGNPNVLFLYEQYADEDAYKAHADSEHFETHALNDIFPRRESADRATYETFEP
ncbi:MAG TPA: putative quinol monooxygenase [Gaiellaceae bacterium]|jgi:quinol monooxygenase YgiN